MLGGCFTTSPIRQVRATYQGADTCGTSYRPGERYLLSVKNTGSYLYIIGGFPCGTRRGYATEEAFRQEWAE